MSGLRLRFTQYKSTNPHYSNVPVKTNLSKLAKPNYCRSTRIY